MDENDLQCPICLELFNYPIILPCSHVLCRSPCAEHLFDFNFIRCPVCRDNCYVSGGINSLPRVIVLENIVQRYKQNQSQREKEVTSKRSVDVLQDSASACASILVDGDEFDLSLLDSNISQNTSAGTAKRSCLEPLNASLPNVETFSSFDLDLPRFNPEASFSINGLCSIHSNVPVTYFCQECRHTCCSNCTKMERHAGHTMLLVDEAYQSMKVRN